MKGIITKNMMEKLSYDSNETQTKKKEPISNSAVMIVFGSADLNAAAYHIAKSLENSDNGVQVSHLLVQESIQDEFISIVQKKLQPYSSKKERCSKFLNEIEVINPKIVMATNVNDKNYSPLLIFNACRSHLVQNGVVIINVFRTTKEAIALCSTLDFQFEVSIWHENHSCAYEIITALKRDRLHSMINCYNVPNLFINLMSCKNNVKITKTYHHESFEIDNMQKYVVFPFGTIFAN